MGVPRSGLLAEYLGGIDNGQVVDSSGNDYHGSISGAVTSDLDGHPLGPSLEFDGASVVSLPEGSYATGATPRTISIWFRANAYLSLRDYFYSSGTNTTLQLLAFNVNGDFLQTVYSNTNDDSTLGSDYAGEWHHVVGVYDGVEFFTYLDSVLAAQSLRDLNTTAGSYHYLGAVESTSSYRWDGGLARVRIYDRALTASEVEELYNEKAIASASLALPRALLVGASLRLPRCLQPLAVSLKTPHGAGLVSACISLSYALRGLVGSAVRAPHGLRTAVAESRRLPLRLSEATPVLASVSLPHAAYDDTPDLPAPISLSIGGREVELLSADVSADEDAFAIQASLELASLEDWLQVRQGDACMLHVAGVTLHLLADERTRTREFGADRFSLAASSPASRMAAPHAGPITRTWLGATARQIAQELCDEFGLALDWRICDWTLESFVTEARTPMETLTTVITAAALAVSAADGSLVVQYRYPESPTRYAKSTPQLFLSDYDDITLLEQEGSPRPGYNKVQLLAEAPGNDAGLWLQEWKGPDGEQQAALPRSQKLVAAFAWPPRDVTLQTSGCDCIVLPQGALTFEHEELLEFVDGEAKSAYPVLEVLESTWRCTDLGGVTAAGTALQAEMIAPGCSLARIRYRSGCQLFLVESRSLESVQVFATAAEAAGESATAAEGLLVTVQRGAGDRPSPETIIDPLCRSLAIMRQRGRNYLDDAGFCKERYEARTPPRALALPGALAQVQDGSLRTVWRGKVTGWQVKADGQGPAASMRWEIERSLT